MNKELMQQALDALVIAEAGLADIGDADREPGDDLAWCERRAANALEVPRKVIVTLKAAIAQPAEPTLTDAQVKAMSEKHQAEAFEEWGQTVQPAVSDAEARAVIDACNMFYSPDLVHDMRRALEAFAASRALPATQGAPAQAVGMSDADITKLALSNGFKLKEQPDGTAALNPYVFDFARVLLATTASKGAA